MRIWEHPLATVATGVVLVVFGVYTRVQSLRSRSWPTVTGVITESYVSTSRRSRSSERSETAHIRYRYAVNGKTYDSDTISYAKGFFDGASTQVSHYPQGSTVPVYYDPRDPASAVLDPGAGPTPGLALLAGVGCFGYAFWRARIA
jgi:hypothetical protein